jgi:hypothetical protein
MAPSRITAHAAAVGIGILASLALTAAPSWAAGGMKLCVPKKEGAGLVTPRHGKCKKGYKLTTLRAEGQAGAEGKQGAAGKAGPEGKQGPEGKLGPEGKDGLSEEELSTLKGILGCIKSIAKGVDGKPTVQFSGCNVQIVNGEAKTASANGEGNLVIGYDEPHVQNPQRPKPPAQTGSHNLILGEEQEFTSYGGIVAGLANSITAPFASATGGLRNNASGELSAVTGGFDSTASGGSSSVSGGEFNDAQAGAGSISGGAENQIVGFVPSAAWIGGGFENKITGIFNKAGEEGASAAIFGGKGLSTNIDFAAIP